jgi:hypothetical protein
MIPLDAPRPDSTFVGFPITLDPKLATVNTALAVANRAQAFRVRDGGTITKVGVSVTTQSGNICLGVYRNTGMGRNARPGTRIATTGSVACPAAGDAEITLGGASYVVYPGDWLVIAADNATAAFRCENSSAANSGFAHGVQEHMDTAFPLPTTFVPVAGSSGLIGRAVLLWGTV